MYISLYITSSVNLSFCAFRGEIIIFHFSFVQIETIAILISKCGFILELNMDKRSDPEQLSVVGIEPKSDAKANTLTTAPNGLWILNRHLIIEVLF